MSHVVLLGDSIFDNASYVPGEPDVIAQLRERLPAGWKATLLAVDGAVTGSVAAQLERMPTDASHLVVSVGGNDALGNIDLLEAPARSVPRALDLLADAAEEFEKRYLRMLDLVLRQELPVLLCSVYYPAFPDAELQRRAMTALLGFNDAIFRAAFARRLPLLDLRLICSESSDYANPIEPSAKGGEKIARAIAHATRHDPFTREAARVYAAAR